MSNHGDLAAHPTRSDVRTEPGGAGAALAVLTRCLAGAHALVGLLALVAAALAVLDYRFDTTDQDSLAGLALLMAAGLAIIGLPLLVLSTVSLLSRRPGWIHGAALLAVAWVALVVLAPLVSASGFWLVSIWLFLLPTQAWPFLVAPTAALLVSAVAGLALRGIR